MVNIISKIKTVCFNRLIIPLTVAVIMILIFIICPFISVFHPENVKDIYSVTNDNDYVKVKADILYYTGYDLVTSGDADYGYYYGIKDGKSIFTIIPINNTPQKILKNYQFTAKVIYPNKAYKKMLSAFTKDINWNTKSLEEVNSNIVLSNADYHPVFYIIFLWIVIVTFLICVKKIVSSICGITNPYMYPVCTFLGKEQQKLLIDEASFELSTENYIQINDMYITENFFIDLSKTKVSIIPLNEIIWCYRMGEFSFNPKDTSPEFTICFMLLSGSVVSAKHKSSDEALELINAIRATDYEIIIGHSEMKRREAKRIVSEEKKLREEN